jgi:hypothetical protein
MKTITITITEALDAAAAAEARRPGVSKSALIRRGLTAVLSETVAERGQDPWRELAGFGASGLTVESGEIDDTLYGAASGS